MDFNRIKTRNLNRSSRGGTETRDRIRDVFLRHRKRFMEGIFSVIESHRLALWKNRTRSRRAGKEAVPLACCSSVHHLGDGYSTMSLNSIDNRLPCLCLSLINDSWLMVISL